MSETMEKWELQELVDEAVATGQIRPEMINEYVYEFKQGGRVIQDLTAASYHQLALNRNITTEEILREDMDDGVMYTVTVAEVNPEIAKELWQRRIGVSFEPFMLGGKFDRFCYQKALTKATRNAIKQLVSATERLDTIAKLKGLAATVGAEEQKALPAPVETKAKPEPELDILRNRCFAIWGKCQPEKGNGTLPADFWEQVKARYGVKSRTTMTLKNWRDCLAWMSDLRNAATGEEPAKAQSDIDADNPNPKPSNKPDVENDEIPI